MLGDHDRRQVWGGMRKGWNDRGISDAKSFDTDHAGVVLNDRAGIVRIAHEAGAGRVKELLAVRPEPLIGNHFRSP